VTGEERCKSNSFDGGGGKIRGAEDAFDLIHATSASGNVGKILQHERERAIALHRSFLAGGNISDIPRGYNQIGN
jgi:hypothetical protein